MKRFTKKNQTYLLRKYFTHTKYMYDDVKKIIQITIHVQFKRKKKLYFGNGLRPFGMDPPTDFN